MAVQYPAENTVSQVIVCPKCERKYQVKADPTGKTMVCPACKTKFTVGQSAPAAPAAPQANPAAMASMGIGGNLASQPGLFPEKVVVDNKSPLDNHVVQDPGFAQVDVKSVRREREAAERKKKKLGDDDPLRKFKEEEREARKQKAADEESGGIGGGLIGGGITLLIIGLGSFILAFTDVQFRMIQMFGEGNEYVAGIILSSIGVVLLGAGAVMKSKN